MTEEYSKQRLQVNNAPDVHFNGALLHEYSTQNKERSKPRWPELRLWVTQGGAWIAESVGCTERQGEADLRDVLVIQIYLGPEEEDDLPDAEARERVMDFFGWSTVAKAFAKGAGWDVVRRVQ